MPSLFWVLFFLIVVSAAIAGVSAAPWLPTRKKELGLLLSALQKHPPVHMIDLGCGDGRVVFAIARQFPDTQCHGVEISLLPFCIALLHKWMYPKRYKNVKIFFKSLYIMPLHRYDTVITFLLSKSYPSLQRKWQKELQKNAHVYIEAWPLPNIKADREIRQEGLLPIFVYSGHTLSNTQNTSAEK